MTPDEHRQLVRERFAAWEEGDSRPFFELLADDVRWTVIGSTAISGTYESKRAFLEEAAGRLGTRLAEPIRAEIRHVFADGEHVIVTWEGHSRGTNGTPYDQTYCWVMRMVDGSVVEATAYLDTELVAAML